MSKTTFVGKGWSAGTSLDVSVAARIWYIGPEDSGTVTIATDVMTLQHGDLASEAVDTTVGSSGVLTMTGATLDTLGEVWTEVNSSPNWYMELEAGMYGDSANTTLLDISETQAKITAGVPIYFDGSESEIVGVSIGSTLFRTCKPSSRIGIKAVKGLVGYVSVTVGSPTGATLNVYSATQTETASTAKLLYSVALADATESVIGDKAVPISLGVYESDIGERLIIRASASTTLGTITAFNVNGTVKDYDGQRI